MTRSRRRPYERVLRWRLLGMTETEAGNLVAWEVGLGAHPKGWTADEVARLMFLAYLRRTGRMRRG